MQEHLRSNEIVSLSWVEALLKFKDIEVFTLDGHISVLEDGAGSIQCRVRVVDEDCECTELRLEEADEGDRVV